MIFSILKILYDGDLCMVDLVSEQVVSFGLSSSPWFVMSINGLPFKRKPIDPDNFRFRGFSLSALHGSDYYNLSDEEYFYLLSNSVSAS